MEITVKKALRLHKTIHTVINKVIDPNLTISLLSENPLDSKKIQDHVKLVKDTVADRIKLIEFHANLRRKIEQQNEKNGVSDLCAKIAALTNQLNTFKTFVALNIPEWNMVVDNVAYRKQTLQKQEAYSSIPTSMNILPFKPEDITVYRNMFFNIKRALEEAEDTRAYMNNINKIEISENEIALLRKYELI